MSRIRPEITLPGSRREPVPGPALVDGRLQVPGQQLPDALGPHAVPRVGAEQRVLDPRAEAPPAEALVLHFPEPGSLLGVEAPLEGEVGADPVGRLLLLPAVPGANHGVDDGRDEHAGGGAGRRALHRARAAALLPAEQASERRPGGRADDLVAALAGALPAQRLQRVLLGHVADLVAQHHGQLRLVLDMGQHAGGEVDPPVRQRGGVRVDVLHDAERERGRRRRLRRNQALA